MTATDSRAQLALILQEIALYMNLLGENPFKVRAHENGSRIIETFEGDLDEAVKSGAIGEIKGIGKGLLDKINEFYSTKQIAEHQSLKKKIPEGLLDLLRIPSLGPKKVKVIYDVLKITSVGELEYACKENRLVKLPGFGEKTQIKILKNIDFLKKYQNKFLYSDAALEAQVLLSSLKSVKGLKQIEVCGSLRRKKEIIGDIDILVSATNAEAITKKFLSNPAIESITGTGETKTSVVLKSGMACDLRVVSEKEFPFALVYFTGSKDHNIELRRIAKEKDLMLNEYGLFEKDKLIPCRTEDEVYQKLGLTFIPPELRESMGEIEASRAKMLPKLIERDEIRGIFHCHTTESDGTNSLEEMIQSAQNLGFEYIGISDHSSSAVYANGLKKDRVLDQFKKIEALQKKFKIKVFKGVESDILANGDLDYDEAILKKFDFVIGSIHGGFSISENEMTKRVLKAIKNPYLDFLGHPTGRLLLAREPFALNMNRIIGEAATTGVIIELNANPQRLDLDWRYGKYLKEKKARVSINPDAHSIAGLEDVDYGIGIARKGWLTAENVVNTLPANKIMSTLRRARNA
jgi:DNA polymerase (family 10)